MLKLFSKSIKLSLVSALTIFSLASVVSASELKESNLSTSPEATLTQFLSSYNKKDADLSASLSEDSRYVTDLQEKNAFSEYFEDPTQILTSFQVLETIKEDSNFALVKARLTFQSEEVFERVFEIKKNNDNWIVILSDTIPNKEEFKQIKQSKEQNPGRKMFENEAISSFNSAISESDEAMIMPRAMLASWSSKFNYDSFTNNGYSASSFNTTYNVALNFRQYGYGTPKFIYSIVRKGGLTGDNAFATSHTQTLSNPSSPKQITLIPGVKSGVYLKAYYDGPYTTKPGVDTVTFGEVYSQ